MSLSPRESAVPEGFFSPPLFLLFSLSPSLACSFSLCEHERNFLL